MLLTGSVIYLPSFLMSHLVELDYSCYSLHRQAFTDKHTTHTLPKIVKPLKVHQKRSLLYIYILKILFLKGGLVAALWHLLIW